MVELGHDSKYYEQYPVNLAPFRTWDMTKNATRYEDLLAAPSDEDRMLMWNLWGAIAGFAIFSTLTVFCGILSNSKVRNSPFNQYLLFLMVPDMVYTGICVVNCFLNVSRGEFYSEFMCYFQSWYAMFGVSGSAWMNALLAREIHRMLSYGQNFRRYVTPTLKQIARDSVCVLLFAAFVSSWGVWKIWLDWMPNQTVLMNGIGCFPQDFDLPTSLFFYLVFFPLLLGFPMAYVLFLGYQIWAKEMLPKQGRRRMLASFFMRLMAIYVIMWTPALLLVSVFNFAFSNPWVEWFGGAWGHFQGPVSAAFILSKDDVKQAVKDMFRCRCQVKDTKKNGRTSSSNRPGRTGSRLANSTRIWLTASKLRLSSTPGGSSHFSSDFQEDWPKSTVTVDEQHDAEQIVGDDIPEQQIGSSNNATPASSFMDEQLKLHNAEIANKEEEDDDDNDDDAGMEDDDSERMMTEFGAVISSRTTTAPQSDNHQDESSSKMEDEPDMEQALPEMQ